MIASQRIPCFVGRRILLVLCLLFSTILPIVVSDDDRTSSSNNRNDNKENDDEFLENDIVGSAVEPHPDPNDEDYPGMIYVGRIDYTTGRRLSNDYDNNIRYIFGTAFDEKHKDILEKDLLHHDNHTLHDIPDADVTHQKTREQILQERRHGNVSVQKGPVPFGYYETNEIDGGIKPAAAIQVEPFFLDATLVTNKEFAKFVKSTYYETEAEKYGWSYVLSTFVSNSDMDRMGQDIEMDPDAEHWIAVPGAYWRQPEGPSSTYKYREYHPVVHVSHRDAAEYCSWVGKRLPGEREWEAAARANQWYNQTAVYQVNHRTLFPWGDDDEWTGPAKQHANLWGQGTFPHENFAEDGWRGTSPVKHYPANILGFYDMLGNVWEWQRGGKLKSRIVRGASYVDTLQGTYNHAATYGARSEIHGTTTTGNVGFRCCKSPKKRLQHHYQWHDADIHGELAVEDQFGKQHMIPEPGWEDRFDPHREDDDDMHYVEEEEITDAGKVITKKKRKKQKRKVVRTYERLSNEL